MWSSSRSHWRVSSAKRRPWSKKEDTTQRKQNPTTEKGKKPQKERKAALWPPDVSQPGAVQDSVTQETDMLKITTDFFLMEGLNAWLSLAQIFIWPLLVLTVGWKWFCFLSMLCWVEPIENNHFTSENYSVLNYFCKLEVENSELSSKK